MAKFTGRNARVLMGTLAAPTELPQANQASISYDRDYSEARVFADDGTNGPWVDQIAGFKSWKVDITAYYDDATDNVLKPMATNTPLLVVVYESRATATRYWYGSAFFNISEDIGTDNVITMKMSGMGTGPLTRIPVPVFP